jgi:hypothetical protein
MDVIRFVDKRRSGEAKLAVSMQSRYGIEETSFGIADTERNNLKRVKWSVE